MTREIKFRYWDMINQEFIQDCDVYFVASDCILAGDLNNPPLIELCGEVIPSQYTGSLDKNGQEIFEGDILKVTSEYEPEDTFNITPVKFENGGFIIETTGFTEYDLTTVGWALQDECILEVIGNRFENPEFLKV